MPNARPGPGSRSQAAKPSFSSGAFVTAIKNGSFSAFFFAIGKFFLNKVKYSLLAKTKYHKKRKVPFSLKEKVDRQSKAQ